MKDDTRLRDDLMSLGSSIVPVAVGEAGEMGLVPGTGVYAALDLGTNNCRLLIACPTDDGFRVVDSFSRIIRLGEGISATGCISDAAIERAIAALEHLPRQDPVQEGQAPAADRDRGLPRRVERARVFATVSPPKPAFASR